jgi:hypothetical protein
LSCPLLIHKISAYRFQTAGRLRPPKHCIRAPNIPSDDHLKDVRIQALNLRKGYRLAEDMTVAMNPLLLHDKLLHYLTGLIGDPRLYPVFFSVCIYVVGKIALSLCPSRPNAKYGLNRPPDVDFFTILSNVIPFVLRRDPRQFVLSSRYACPCVLYLRFLIGSRKLFSRSYPMRVSIFGQGIYLIPGTTNIPATLWQPISHHSPYTNIFSAMFWSTRKGSANIPGRRLWRWHYPPMSAPASSHATELSFTR